ncbi:26S proteasome non-ATPase regulatory subunit 1 [Tyrophagus putrescentiae]|nr:26S proteasome non-ATPase regulatory subunit 1 [Tyrophagus putrescentiae]
MSSSTLTTTIQEVSPGQQQITGRKRQLPPVMDIISMLSDSSADANLRALEQLNTVVGKLEEVVPKIEILYEDESFPHRQLAALVASKVYYHLGSLEDSLTYALGAGPLFNVTATSEYVETIVSKSIDHYIKLRAASASATTSGANKPPIDSRLEDIVNRMFQRCFEDGQFKQAIDTALKTRRLDVFEQAILCSTDRRAAFTYAFEEIMCPSVDVDFRQVVLQLITAIACRPASTEGSLSAEQESSAKSRTSSTSSTASTVRKQSSSSSSNGNEGSSAQQAVSKKDDRAGGKGGHSELSNNDGIQQRQQTTASDSWNDTGIGKGGSSVKIDYFNLSDPSLSPSRETSGKQKQSVQQQDNQVSKSL